jgi:sulfate adenylyltransferase
MPNTPYGGELINRINSSKASSASSLVQIPLDEVAKADLLLIATGGFSPLIGFQDKANYDSVVEHMQLKNGLPWSIPITLPVADDLAKKLKSGTTAALTLDGKPVGTIDVEEIFSIDPKREAKHVYRTEDEKHPGVARIYQAPTTRVSGPVTLFAEYARDFAALPQTPADVRKLITEKGWKRTVAFQTRNPIHRAHEYITKVALEIVDGLIIHPLVGATKSDDTPADKRVKSYEALINGYYNKDRVLLAAFPAAMRYAGPREAVLHAIARKNFGATHFIVGRDHAGVGNYYGTYDAQKLFDEIDLNKLGITPLMFENSFWCKRVGGMATSKTTPGTEAERVSLSGTKVREMLNAGQLPPPEFSRREVVQAITDVPLTQTSVTGKGLVLWFTGLSGAGKSTIAEALTKKLEARGKKIDILDGDVVRTHLSKGLGFSKEDRDENIRRIGFVAGLVAKHGGVAITAAISPYASVRDECRTKTPPEATFVEIFVDTPLEVCEQRDVKGLYKKARAGEIKQFTGISDPYEAPTKPEITLYTHKQSLDECVATIENYLASKGLL